MQSSTYDPIGIAPPKGRQGHSVPTPQPLGLEPSRSSGKGLSNQPLFPKLDSWPTTDLQHSGSSSGGSSSNAMSPAQFYAHRDHVFGGSLSKLDRMRSHQDSLLMEAFDETEEYEGTDQNDFCAEVGSRSPSCSPSRKASFDFSGGGNRKTSTHRGGGNTHMSLDKLTGDSLLFFSYSAAAGGSGSGLNPDSQLGGSFVRAFTQGLNSSLSGPYLQGTSPGSTTWGGAGSGEQFPLFPTAARNPNKAIITIDARESRILVANEMTCELFGYQPDELSGMKIQSLFTEPYRGKQRALMEQNISISGETFLISGKVMDAVTSYGVEFPVSVWMRRVGGEGKVHTPDPDLSGPRPQAPPTPRVIVVIEPVKRSSALFSLDSDHMIVSCDPWFACLFGFQDSSEVIGKRVTELVPSLTLPSPGEEPTMVACKQAVTGRAKGGTVFPLTIKFTNNVSQSSLSISDLYSPTHTAHQPSTPPSSPVTNQTDSAQPSSAEDGTPSFACPSSEDHTPSSSAAPYLEDHTPPPTFSSSADPTSTSPSTGHTPPMSSADHSTGHALLTSSDTDHTPPSVVISPDHTPLSAVSCTDPTPSSLSSDPTPSSAFPSSTDPSQFLSPSPLPGCVNAKAIVYAALSGMISFFADGAIHGCNHHFALMLFGYTQQELLKKDITFLLPDFYQHIGFVDDRFMPLPPVDEEDDFLFHYVAERSLSPDKAADMIKSLQDARTRSPRHQQQQQQLLSPTRRHPSPLQFPDLSTFARNSESSSESRELAQEMSKGRHTPSSQSGDSVRTIGRSTSCEDTDHMSCDPEHVSHDAEHMSHDAQHMSCDTPDDNDIPSVQSIGLSQPDLQPGLRPDLQPDLRPDLPPVPNKLVPSKSTERIMDILKQRGLGLEPALSTPLSSTPAAKSRENIPSHNSSMNSQQHGMFDQVSLGSLVSIQEGTFLGDARHKDGSLMAVVFQLKRITLVDDRDIYCMWLSRDLDMERARTADLSMSMSRPTLHDPYGQHLVISPEVGISGGGPDSTDGGPVKGYGSSPEEALAMEGEYSSSYNTLRPMGKGAFGFVRLAQKITDESMVVVKFLRKSSVLKDCWVSDQEMGVVPLEIALLARLSHDNIVRLLEAYENEHFFQMVMEKHGEGLDLFEFIERSPRLTEKHISYIFRQLISALDYLHGQSIVHRDIKDENIIINQNFDVKLIDFGSAAHMAPGKYFNTFCGTLEYCSPEVLLGNSYKGPELEMWAVGVTLYTLVFGENPFLDVEETISGHLQPPFLTSPALMKVLFWLLHPDPTSRATIRDLRKDKWTNQKLDDTQLNFEAVLGRGVGGPNPLNGAPLNGAPLNGAPLNGARPGFGKSNSEGKAVQLSRSMMEQLVVSDKGGGASGKEEDPSGKAWC